MLFDFVAENPALAERCMCPVSNLVPRGSVLAQHGGAGSEGGGGLGSAIVGGSLAAVPDSDARELFVMLAVAGGPQAVWDWYLARM